jgi:hypothetical protein
MTWVAIDDQAPRHPKLVNAGYQTWPLWLAGLCYCGAHLTDGFIPRAVLTTLVPSLPPRRAIEHASKLVVAGLWLIRADGFQVHDYLTFNKSRERVLKERADAIERRKRGGHRANVGGSPVASRHVSNGNTPPPLPSDLSFVDGRAGNGAASVGELALEQLKAMGAVVKAGLDEATRKIEASARNTPKEKTA